MWILFTSKEDDPCSAAIQSHHALHLDTPTLVTIAVQIKASQKYEKHFSVGKVKQKVKKIL